MKITKNTLKQLIKEEFEAPRIRTMSPDTRGKRKVAHGWAHKGDMSPEEVQRKNTEMKHYSKGYEDGLNGRPDKRYEQGAPGAADYYAPGYVEGSEAARKGESYLTPYEIEQHGLDEPRIGTRPGPYKDKYAAQSPEEIERYISGKYAGASGGDEIEAWNDPRNPAYARPVNEMKITKNTLKQLIREELMNEYENPAYDRAEDAARADIDAKFSARGPGGERAAAKYKEKYSKGFHDGMDTLPISGRIQRLGVSQLKGSGASRKYYHKGYADASRISGAPETPHERLADPVYAEMGLDSPGAKGPYISGVEARLQGRARDRAEHAAAIGPEKHSAELQGAYQSLGDAALRGSAIAMRKLKRAAKYDPDAQEILDAVLDEQATARAGGPGPPLPADLEADTLEEIIRRESFKQKGKTKMKLTKNTLKKLIKEELEDMTETLPGHRTAAPTAAERAKRKKKQAAREKCVKDAVARGKTQKQAESACKVYSHLEKEPTDESVESVNEKVEAMYESLTRRLKRLERLIDS